MAHISGFGSLSWPQSRDGLAIRSRARHAGKSAHRGLAGSHSAYARAPAGDCSSHWRGGGRRRRAVSRHAALASGSPADRPWGTAVVPARSPAMGGHAGGNARPDALVIPDGVGAWRGTDGPAGVSVDDGGGRRSFLPCTGG